MINDTLSLLSSNFFTICIRLGTFEVTSGIKKKIKKSDKRATKENLLEGRNTQSLIMEYVKNCAQALQKQLACTKLKFIYFGR